MIICIFLYGGILTFDLLPLFKRKDKKAVSIYISIFVFTLIVNIFYGLGFNIPSPAGPIADFINSLLKLK